MATLTIKGIVRFDGSVIPASLLAHLADCLRNVDASDVSIEGNRVMFSGGIFRFVTNWNAGGPFKPAGGPFKPVVGLGGAFDLAVVFALPVDKSPSTSQPQN